MEKPFVIRWNIIGFAGGGAFFLSLVLGIVSGNPFLSIILRACLSGAAFGLLALGATFVLERFIPQLFGDAETPPETERRGANVDILLDGEARDAGEIEELSIDERTRGDSPGPLSAAGRFSEAAENQGPPADLSDGAETPGGEGVPSAGEDGMLAAEEEPDMAGSEDSAGEAVLEEDGDTGPMPAAAGKRVEAGETDDIDVLPDMSRFESSFSPVTSAGMVNDSDSFDSFSTEPLKQKGLDGDPATYAKAMRTVIRRDEGKKK